MGLKDFYVSLEEKYYGFLDWLDNKGVPVYSAVDALEKNGIPSFPIAIILLLLILGLIGWFFVLPAVLPQETTTIKLLDAQSGEGIAGATLNFEWQNGAAGETIAPTNDAGEYQLKGRRGSTVIAGNR